MKSIKSIKLSTMRKLSLICFLTLFAGTFSFAQNEVGEDAFGLNLGNYGFGVDYARNMTEKITLRGRLQALPFKLEDFGSLSLNGKPTVIDTDVKIHNASVLADWYPFKNSSFKLIGGVSYFFNNELSSDILVNETVSLGEGGEFVFTPEDLGRISIDVEWNKVAPFLGLGFGRAVPNKIVALSVEVGAFYVGEPKVGMDVDGLLAGTAESADDLEAAISTYSFLPQINARIAFRID